MTEKEVKEYTIKMINNFINYIQSNIQIERVEMQQLKDVFFETKDKRIKKIVDQKYIKVSKIEEYRNELIKKQLEFINEYESE